MNFRSPIIISILVVFAASPVSSAHAAKETFVRSKPHVNIGTIGHVRTAKPSSAMAAPSRTPRNNPKLIILDEPANAMPEASQPGQPQPAD